MVTLTIEMEDETSERLRQLAASKGRSVAELLRSGVDVVLNSGERLADIRGRRPPPPPPSEAKRATKAPSLTERESDLLLRINRGLPDEAAAHYRQLARRRREHRLSPAEHAELLRLTDQVEALQAQRMEGLSELARLRGISLRAVMEQLGIAPAADA